MCTKSMSMVTWPPLRKWTNVTMSMSHSALYLLRHDYTTPHLLSVKSCTLNDDVFVCLSVKLIACLESLIHCMWCSVYIHFSQEKPPCKHAPRLTLMQFQWQRLYCDRLSGQEICSKASISNKLSYFRVKLKRIEFEPKVWKPRFQSVVLADN